MSSKKKKQQQPKRRKPKSNKKFSTRHELIQAGKVERAIYQARFEFTGEVTDNLQRVCKTNLTGDMMQIIVNLEGLDWVFECVAICDGYEKSETEIFRNRTFNSLDKEVKALQKRVKDNANVKHLHRINWYARVVKPGEYL